MSIELTSAAAILAVPLTDPERVFSGAPGTLQQEWRHLAALWHPDRHGGALEAQHAFQHLAALREAAHKRLATGLWTQGNEARFTTQDGRQFRQSYVRRQAFELGESYLGRETMAFAVTPSARDLFQAALARITGLDFADEAMRRQMSGSLPSVSTTFETAGHLIMIVRRAPGFVALGDLIAHLGGKLDPRHLAWVVSGLENIACYLSQRGLVHGGIGLQTVFVSPARHQVALLGGWWYASRAGDRLRALPEAAMRTLPPMILAAGRAAPAIDLELIRALAREAAGDPSGSRILRDSAIPPPFARWMTGAPEATALADYAAWETARAASFGNPRFVALNVSAGDIYTTPAAPA